MSTPIALPQMRSTLRREIGHSYPIKGIYTFEIILIHRYIQTTLSSPNQWPSI